MMKHWTRTTIYFAFTFYWFENWILTGDKILCPPHCHCTSSTVRFMGLDIKTIACENLSLIEFPQNISMDTEALIFRHNILGHSQNIDLVELLPLRKLVWLDVSSNRIRIFKNQAGSLESLRYLNLSYNVLISLDTGMFRGFPQLQVLNLSSNRITTISPMSLEIPSLKTLDLSHNRLSCVLPHHFADLRSLTVLQLSNNHITKIADTSLHHMGTMELVDLDHNRISKIDEGAFKVVSEIKELKLSGNHLSKVPTAALSAVGFIEIINLKDNFFKSLLSGSLESVNTSSVDLSENGELLLIQDGAFANMKFVTSIKICNNRNLKFISPNAFTNLPRLSILDIRNNSLLTMDERIYSHLPANTSVDLSGNPLLCDCSIRWIYEFSNVTLDNSTYIRCFSKFSNKTLFPSECSPTVIPIFPDYIEEFPTGNVEVICAATGIPRPEISWSSTNGTTFSSGSPCTTRACATSSSLTIKYLQSEDTGFYTCTASNTFGNSSRELHLLVKDLNIQIVPITVTSNFITLTWNTTSAISTAYVLQYCPEGSEQVLTKTISMGVKVHSHTLSGLSPGLKYNIWLGLKKDGVVVRISTVALTTKEEGFFLMLGIHTNYLSVILVITSTSIMALGCISTCVVRCVRWRFRKHNEMIPTDNMSQRCFARSESNTSDLAAMTYVNVADETELVDEET